MDSNKERLFIVKAVIVLLILCTLMLIIRAITPKANGDETTRYTGDSSTYLQDDNQLDYITPFCDRLKEDPDYFDNSDNAVKCVTDLTDEQLRLIDFVMKNKK